MPTQEQQTVNNIAASGTFTAGDAIGLNSGLGRPLVAGDPFLGFANNSGVGGEIIEYVPTQQGARYVLPIAGLVATDLNANVYASDATTFTLTSTSNSLIGRLLRLEGTNGIVQLN